MSTITIKKGQYNVMMGRPAKTRHMVSMLLESFTSYRSLIDQLQQAQRLSPLLLKQAATNSNRAEAIISAMEKRGNVLLNMALEVAGMKRYIGKWTLQIDRDPKQILLDVAEGNIRFILSHDYKHRWEGNIRQCPLLKIMRMSFRTEWLHMSTKKVQQEMCHLLRAGA